MTSSSSASADSSRSRTTVKTGMDVDDDTEMEDVSLSVAVSPLIINTEAPPPSPSPSPFMRPFREHQLPPPPPQAQPPPTPPPPQTSLIRQRRARPVVLDDDNDGGQQQPQQQRQQQPQQQRQPWDGRARRPRQVDEHLQQPGRPATADVDMLRTDDIQTEIPCEMRAMCENLLDVDPGLEHPPIRHPDWYTAGGPILDSDALLVRRHMWIRTLKTMTGATDIVRITGDDVTEFNINEDTGERDHATMLVFLPRDRMLSINVCLSGYNGTSMLIIRGARVGDDGIPTPAPFNPDVPVMTEPNHPTIVFSTRIGDKESERRTLSCSSDAPRWYDEIILGMTAETSSRFWVPVAFIAAHLGSDDYTLNAIQSAALHLASWFEGFCRERVPRLE